MAVTRERFFGALRLIAAVVGLVALASRFVYGLGFSSFVSLNFFAYLTVQSNMLAVAVHAIGGVALMRGVREPSWSPALRLTVTTFMLVAGLVFTVLVAESGSRGYPIEVPWSDQVLHYVIPAYLLLDWLFGPGDRQAPWRSLWGVLGYPLVWGIITLIRGPIVGWYPYFFLDPEQVGVAELAGYSAAALGLFAGVAATLLGLARLEKSVVAVIDRRRRKARVRASPA